MSNVYQISHQKTSSSLHPSVASLWATSPVLASSLDDEMINDNGQSIIFNHMFRITHTDSFSRFIKKLVLVIVIIILFVDEI